MSAFCRRLRHAENDVGWHPLSCCHTTYDRGSLWYLRDVRSETVWNLTFSLFIRCLFFSSGLPDDTWMYFRSMLNIQLHRHFDLVASECSGVIRVVRRHPDCAVCLCIICIIQSDICITASWQTPTIHLFAATLCNARWGGDRKANARGVTERILKMSDVPCLLSSLTLIHALRPGGVNLRCKHIHVQAHPVWLTWADHFNYGTELAEEMQRGEGSQRREKEGVCVGGVISLSFTKIWLPPSLLTRTHTHSALWCVQNYDS